VKDAIGVKDVPKLVGRLLGVAFTGLGETWWSKAEKRVIYDHTKIPTYTRYCLTQGAYESPAITIVFLIVPYNTDALTPFNRVLYNKQS
jgi:hypothetical protein